MGSIVDGISSLFGGGSNNRGATRDTNSQGGSLGQANQTLSSDNNNLNTATNVLGGTQGAIANQGAALGAQSANGFQQTGIAGQAGQAYNSDYGSAINASLGADGFTKGPNGQETYNSSFNPYAQTGNSLISQYSDSVAPQYQNAINATQHDDLARGVTGTSTISAAQDAQTRNAQAADVANFGRNLGVQAQNEQYSRLGNAMNLINGAGQTAQEGYGAAANTYGNVASGYGSQGSGIDSEAGAYGNIGNEYANESNSYDNNASGYAAGSQNYQNQANQQTSGLTGLASLFGF